MCVAIEPSVGQENDIDAWYRQEHLRMSAANAVFLRCDRFERMSVPGVVSEANTANTAKLLAVHEYTSVQDILDHAIYKGRLVEETDWTRRVMDNAKSVERSIWTVC